MIAWEYENWHGQHSLKNINNKIKVQNRTKVTESSKAHNQNLTQQQLHEKVDIKERKNKQRK